MCGTRWWAIVRIACALAIVLSIVSFGLSEYWLWCGKDLTGMPDNTNIMEINGKYFWGYNRTGGPPKQEYLRAISKQQFDTRKRFDSLASAAACIGGPLLPAGVIGIIVGLLKRRSKLDETPVAKPYAK